MAQSTDSSGRVRIAVVGLQFGSAFVPIYQRHPDIVRVAICDTDPNRRQDVGARFGVPETDQFASLDEILGDPEIDAVHLVTPVRFHAAQSIAVLNSRRHCACAVPMAVTVDDLFAILRAARSSHRRYMMMETAIYTREFLYARELLASGAIGQLTFLRGAHQQDIEGLPDYWKGYPPMHYITHALAPLLALAGARAEKVSCVGSGTLRPDLRQTETFSGAHGAENPFPLQSAHFRLANTDLAAEVTMSFFQTARPYVESFSVYGDAGGFEWEQLHGDRAVRFTLEPLAPNGRGRFVRAERVDPPFRPDLLPPELAEFADGGHGGSHPHLVHEFLRSIADNRPSIVDEVTAAHYSGAGLIAHQSALQGGELLQIPDFGA